MIVIECGLKALLPSRLTGNLPLWETDMVITPGAVNARIALITSKPLPAS